MPEGKASGWLRGACLQEHGIRQLCTVFQEKHFRYWRQDVDALSHLLSHSSHSTVEQYAEASMLLAPEEGIQSHRLIDIMIQSQRVRLTRSKQTDCETAW